MSRKMISSGVSQYTGEFGYPEAKHLLNRALFGAKHSEIETCAAKTLDEVVEDLLDDSEQTLHFPLVNSDADAEEPVALGKTWVNEDTDKNNGNRRDSLYTWQFGEWLEQKVTLREKMGLFFFNHMPVQSNVYSGLGLYRYHEFFKDNYMGNLKEIVKHVCVDYAMLRFLNGYENVASQPNENFARELLELFTIGKGPQVGEGDYTHYTEEDVKATAKVMTGWGVNWAQATSNFNSRKHDKSTKTFSHRFDHAVIFNLEDNEYKALVDLIMEKKECARFFVRKLYRFFVHSHIDTTIETNVIEPLAAILYDGNYELKPLYEALFKSQHFFDSDIRGGLIASPFEYLVGTFKRLEVPLPPKNEVDRRFKAASSYFYWYCRDMGQEGGNPPSVAGWQAYYAAPSFHRKWVDSVTFPKRQGLPLAIVWTPSPEIWGTSFLYTEFGLNYVALQKVISDISQFSRAVKELSDFLLPQSLGSSVIDTLALKLEQHYVYVSQDFNDNAKVLVDHISVMPEFQLI